IIASRRSNSAHLHRPWRATPDSQDGAVADLFIARRSIAGRQVLIDAALHPHPARGAGLLEQRLIAGLLIHLAPDRMPEMQYRHVPARCPAPTARHQEAVGKVAVLVSPFGEGLVEAVEGQAVRAPGRHVASFGAGPGLLRPR